MAASDIPGRAAPEHYWQSLPGFFTFPDYYARLAAKIALAATLRPQRVVEVGVYAGQSAAFLGVALLQWPDRVDVRLDLVDMFHGGTKEIEENVRPIRAVIGNVVAGDSAASASHYADGSVDAVFIDADHAYESVARDIDAWLPKVRAGGIIAGHDFTLEFPGVIQAVTERFARFEIWRGRNDLGDERMRGKFYPVWSVQL